MGMKMRADYAQGFITEGRAGHWRFVSCHGGPISGLLVIEDLEVYYGEPAYLGHQLKEGKLQVDEEGYVVFEPVKPIIDENTKFKL
jgi:hypothetical protein